MKSLAKFLLVSFGLLAVAACQTTTQNPTDKVVGLHEAVVEIIAVKSEIDGNSVVVRDEGGTTYEAIFSIPNLGPDSDFDFDELRVGNHVVVTGETWTLAGKNQLTVREAKAILN
jgi:hypothetical protein